MATLQSINERVRISGISKIELSLEELGMVLQTLVMDGRLEEVRASAMVAVSIITGASSSSSSSGSSITYKTATSLDSALLGMGYFTAVPCLHCPVASQCCIGGIISPHTCQYMAAWTEQQHAEARGDDAKVVYLQQPNLQIGHRLPDAVLTARLDGLALR